MIWGTIAAALVVHGILIGTVKGLDLQLAGGFVRHEAKVAEVEQDLTPGCVGDAFLASGARMTMCFAPWHDDVDRCIDDAQTNMIIDLSSCQARSDRGVAVAMLEPRATDKVKSIDPEPLLEMLKEDQPKPKPLEVPPPQPAPPAPPPPPAKAAPKQIVETARPSNEQAPDNARFLAEYDTRVEHQTVARGTPKEPMVAKSKPEELQAKDHPKEASIKPPDEDRPRGADARAPDVPGSLSMRKPGLPSPATAQQEQKTAGSTAGASGPVALDGYTPRRGDGALEQQRQDRSEQPRGQGGAGGGTPDVPNLKPSQEVLERALGGGNVDHLEEVDNGDETSLNAKRFIYASFFNRLKRSVAQNWDPAGVWRHSDPTGQVYGFKTRITEVRVSLSPRGELLKVVVTSPSGVGELDDEAVRAFHAAGPFPNPPKELVSSDNQIVFAFSFFFEIGAPHTSWHVLRSQ